MRKTGRAELDEHAAGVNTSEFIANINPDSKKTRQEILEEIRDAVTGIPGVVVSVEQPLAHLISHMLSGVKAQVGIKLYGENLDLSLDPFTSNGAGSGCIINISNRFKFRRATSGQCDG